MSVRGYLAKAAAFAVVAMGAAGAAAAAEVPAGLDRITLLTGAPGGSWYAYSAGIAEMLTEAGVPTTPEQGGGNSNIMNIAAGNAEIGFGLTAANHAAKIGKEPFSKPVSGVTAISVLFPQYAHTAVTADSGVKSYADLKGKRMASQSRSTGSRWIFNDTLLAYGLDGGEDALDIAVRGGPGVGGQAVRDRQAIGFIATVFPPASAFSETAASMPIRLLPIDDAAYAKMQELNPGYGRGVIPGGIYPGVDEDVPTVTDDTVLLAPANLPEEHGYWIARTLAENAEKLTKLGPPFKNFSPKMMPKVMVLDLHPGAKRYYQEAGLLP